MNCKLYCKCDHVWLWQTGWQQKDKKVAFEIKKKKKLLMCVRPKFESCKKSRCLWVAMAHSKMMQSRTLRRSLMRDRADVMALAHSLLRDAPAAVTLYFCGTCLCLTTVLASLQLNTAARAEHESEQPVTLQITMVIQRPIYRAAVGGLIKLRTTKGSRS